jgi:hypothetical protein
VGLVSRGDNTADLEDSRGYETRGFGTLPYLLPTPYCLLDYGACCWTVAFVSVTVQFVSVTVADVSATVAVVSAVVQFVSTGTALVSIT